MTFWAICYSKNKNQIARSYGVELSRVERLFQTWNMKKRWWCAIHNEFIMMVSWGKKSSLHYDSSGKDASVTEIIIVAFYSPLISRDISKHLSTDVATIHRYVPPNRAFSDGNFRMKKEHLCKHFRKQLYNQLINILILIPWTERRHPSTFPLTTTPIYVGFKNY